MIAATIDARGGVFTVPPAEAGEPVLVMAMARGGRVVFSRTVEPGEAEADVVAEAWASLDPDDAPEAA